MELLTNYLLESSICLIIFFVFFQIFLKPLVSFSINRFYLVLSLALSFVIPLISIGVFPIYETAAGGTLVSYAPNHETTIPTSDLEQLNLSTILVWSYLFILIVLFCRLIYNNAQILIKISSSERQSKGYYTIVENQEETKIYSFFKYLIKPKSEKLDPLILEHELTHISQKHSWDILISEMAKTVLWFNPIVYLFQNAMKLNHEYICDEKASQLSNNYKYAQFLALVNQKHYKLSLVNNFSYKLKNRIIMLQKLNQASKRIWPYVLVVPLVVCVMSLFSFDDYYVPISENNNNTVIDSIPKTRVERVDTVVTFDYDTNKETVQLIKTKIEYDTISIFDIETYVETTSIIENTNDCYYLTMGDRAFSTTHDINAKNAQKIFQETIKFSIKGKDCAKVSSYSGRIVIVPKGKDPIVTSFSKERQSIKKGIIPEDYYITGTTLFLEELKINEKPFGSSIVIKIK